MQHLTGTMQGSNIDAEATIQSLDAEASHVKSFSSKYSPTFRLTTSSNFVKRIRSDIFPIPIAFFQEKIIQNVSKRNQELRIRFEFVIL